MSLEYFMKIYSNDDMFLNSLESVKVSLNEISDILEQIDFEYDEYYNFLSIKKMITYIVDNLEKYFYHSSFIIQLLENFKDLITKESILEDYSLEYEKFDTFLYEQEDYFLY